MSANEWGGACTCRAACHGVGRSQGTRNVPTATHRSLSAAANAFLSNATTPLEMLAPTTMMSPLVATADPALLGKVPVRGQE